MQNIVEDSCTIEKIPLKLKCMFKVVASKVMNIICIEYFAFAVNLISSTKHNSEIELARLTIPVLCLSNLYL